MTTRLSPHFTLEELGGAVAPDGIKAALRITATYMEAFREIIGTAFNVTSGYRTPEHNQEVGGSETSDHVNGLALDGYFDGRTMWQVYNRLMTLRRAGGLPPFDQITFYPVTTGHIHFGFGGKMRGQVLAKQANGGYTVITDAVEWSMPGWGGSAIGPTSGSAPGPLPVPVAAPSDKLPVLLAAGAAVIGGLLAWLYYK